MDNFTAFAGEEDRLIGFASSTPYPSYNVSSHHYLFEPEYGDGGLGNYSNGGDNSTVYLPSVRSTVPTEILDMMVALEDMRFVVQMILVPILTFMGVMGNLTTICVLTRRDMRSSTNYYLTALAISDMVYLLMFFSLSVSHHPGMRGGHSEAYWHFYKYALWINDAASATSTWITVTFTIERYIAVCHPMKGMVFCTPARALKAIVAVYMSCYLLTATTPHEWIVATAPAPDGASLVVTLEASDLGNNDTYITIFFWFSAIMFTILPLILLSVFNTFLIVEVRRTNNLRRTLSERPTSRKAQVGKVSRHDGGVLFKFCVRLTTSLPLTTSIARWPILL